MNQSRRYPGVNPFEFKERDRFFGRESDIRDLYGMIQLEKLVVLFGKSGFGKSSLLNAGILPRFKAESPEGGRSYQPILVRFGAYDASKRPPTEEVALRIAESAKPTSEGLFLDKMDGSSSLWQQLKLRQTASNRQFLFVFDQFEEFFSYPIAQQERFSAELGELLYTDIPQAFFEDFDTIPGHQQEFLSKALDVKAVFVIRSDRLHFLDLLKNHLPAILHKRYELKALTREQAREAVTKPARLEGDFLSPKFEYTQDAINSILDRLGQSGRDAAQTGIEAFRLQILCQHFEDKVIDGSVQDHTNDGIPDIRPEDLPNFSEIYASYYRRRLTELPEEDQLPARLLIENGLLFVDRQTGEARRLSVDGQALLSQLESRGASQSVLDFLEKTYLVRREISSTGGYNYEISHDTLIAPILEAKRVREAAEEQENRARQAEAERAEAERRAEEAEARVAEESQRRIEAERLKKAADSGRRRASFLFVLASFLLFGAIYAWKSANKARTEAEDNLQRFKAEQLKTDRTEVEKLRQRADDLYETGYWPSAKALYQRANSIAERHPEDPLLKAVSDSLQIKIKASQ